jgi:hypothetical protein
MPKPMFASKVLIVSIFFSIFFNCSRSQKFAKNKKITENTSFLVQPEVNQIILNSRKPYYLNISSGSILSASFQESETGMNFNYLRVGSFLNSACEFKFSPWLKRDSKSRLLINQRIGIYGSHNDNISVCVQGFSIENNIFSETYVENFVNDFIAPSNPKVYLGKNESGHGVIKLETGSSNGSGEFRYTWNNPEKSFYFTSGGVIPFPTQPPHNLPNGTHVLFVSEKDAAGNWSLNSRLVLNSTAPASSLLPALDVRWTHTQSPKVLWGQESILKAQVIVRSGSGYSQARVQGLNEEVNFLGGAFPGIGGSCLVNLNATCELVFQIKPRQNTFGMRTFPVTLEAVSKLGETISKNFDLKINYFYCQQELDSNKKMSICNASSVASFVEYKKNQIEDFNFIENSGNCRLLSTNENVKLHFLVSKWFEAVKNFRTHEFEDISISKTLMLNLTRFGLWPFLLQTPNQVYLGLQETEPHKFGFGVVLVAFGIGAMPSKWLLEVPHPIHDTGTSELAGELLDKKQQAVFIQAGVHRRCSKKLVSEVVPGNTDPNLDYRESDPAHNSEHAFHIFHSVFSLQTNHTIQLHGFGGEYASEQKPIEKAKPPFLEPPFSKVILSAGSFLSDNPFLKKIALPLLEIGIETKIFPSFTENYGAQSNVQGHFDRQLNSEKFAHIEMELELRTTQNGRQRMIDALLEAQSL